MSRYFVVPDQSGYGAWAIKKNGRKVSNAQTQATAKNTAKRKASKGDEIVIYGSRNKQIVDSITVQ